MAFSGREQYREFEEATANIFREIFKFNSTWLGSAGAGFQAIIDTKAYSRYDLPTNHRDRMIYHYLPDIKKYERLRNARERIYKNGRKNSTTPYNHVEIKNIFSLNRRVNITDL